MHRRTTPPPRQFSAHHAGGRGEAGSAVQPSGIGGAGGGNRRQARPSRQRHEQIFSAGDDTGGAAAPQPRVRQHVQSSHTAALKAVSTPGAVTRRPPTPTGRWRSDCRCRGAWPPAPPAPAPAAASAGHWAAAVHSTTARVLRISAPSFSRASTTRSPSCHRRASSTAAGIGMCSCFTGVTYCTSLPAPSAQRRRAVTSATLPVGQRGNRQNGMPALATGRRMQGATNAVSQNASMNEQTSHQSE